MDKYLVRRASPSKNDSKAKRVKSAPEEEEGNNPPARRGASVKKKKSTKSLREEEDDDDDAESSGVDGDIYGGLAFEDEPLAAIESLNDVIGGDGGGSGTSEKTEEEEEQPTLYRSSIYVDAFNMALDTVLEQEAHLFTDPEKAVFAAWRLLDYEAQYLYVRLFLRKQAAWHRIQRLDYRADIGDLARAVETLQKDRACGGGGGDSGGGEDGGGEDGDWSLGPSFSFAQTLDNVEIAIDEVVGLLSLSELKAMAKQIRAVGKSKAELQAGIVRVTTKQMTLTSAGQLLRRQSSTEAGSESPKTINSQPPLRRNSSTSSGREEELTAKIMAITGPCIRICPAVFKLFERVHLVFYRTSEWTDKSLTTLVLAKMSKRNFPQYVVSRTANIFASRQQLLDFEAALRLQHRVDQILNNNMSSGGGEDGYQQVVDLFNSIGAHWRGLVKEELAAAAAKYDDEYDEYSYLRRFKAAHVLTRVAHYAAYCMGRLHDYRSEHALLGELLGQRLLHLARRGVWYQRKALIEERYMAVASSSECGSKSKKSDEQQQQQKKLWWSRALATCEAGLQDRDCHTIFHHDLQKRIVKLEKRLRIPRRLQHDFGHLRLLQPEEHVIEGIQVKRAVEGGGLFNNKKRKGSASVGERTVWIDEGENEGKDVECTVEEMCLREYRRRGWKGYHAEGGIVRTLFAYLFYDVLFMYVPNVFQTAYQACPLDLHTDAFYAARASAINRRLVEIANGEAPRIVRAVHAAQAARRTCIVGLRWEQFGLDDLVELVACFRGDALALVCKVLAQEYRQRGGGGLPDLLLWRRAPTPEVLFAEVKSANDRLSETQRMWIHVLAGAGVRVAVCHAVAKETRVR